MSMNLHVAATTDGIDLCDALSPTWVSKVAMMERDGKIPAKTEGEGAIHALRVYVLWYASLPITDLQDHNSTMEALAEHIRAAERGDITLKAWWD